MEFAGHLRPSEACNYLAVPGLTAFDPDEDEGDLVGGFRPKSSPIPSRRSSVSDEDSDPELPLCGSRRVSFADAKGLSLVQVKEFDTWDVPKLPGNDFTDVEGRDSEEYHLSPLTFSLPLSSEEVLAKVLNQKVELETIGLLPGTTILKGVIRVLNISYNKSVYIRTSLDRWGTHFDLLAEYVPGYSDGVTDSFSFKLTLGPPFGDQGVRVDFCLRYETTVGTFWANNNNRNYVLFCQRRMKEGTEKPQRENTNKKSCLKTISRSVSTVENISTKQASSQENMSADESVQAPEVGTLETKKISEGQSATSNGEGLKLLMENKQNSSRRRQRQAARMARLRDYYAQRDGGANDAGKDEQTPETKQATLKETPGDNVVGFQTLKEVEIKSECPQIVFEALEACSTPLSKAAHDHTSTKQVKSDLSVLTRGESASDISNNLPHSVGEPALAEQQHISEFITTNRDGDMSLACTNNSATGSSEIFISQSDGFTFGTVVAPLYRQAFQRVSTENPTNTREFSRPPEPRQTCAIVPINTRSSMGKVQENMSDSHGSNDECLAVKLIGPASEEKETLNKQKETLNKIPKGLDIVQNAIEMEKKPDQGGTNKSLDQQCLLGDNVPSENVHSQMAAQEDILLFEPPQCQSPEQSSLLILTKVEETLAKSESEKGLNTFQIILEHAVEGADELVNGVQENNCKCTEVNKKNESRKIDTSLMEDKLLQVFTDLNTNQTDSKFCLNNLVYLHEPEKTNLTSLDGSLETQEKTKMENEDIFGSGDIKVTYEDAQSIINKFQSNNHCNADMSGMPNDQNVLEEEGQCEIDSSLLKQGEDSFSIDTDEGKNWEMMVEEEEKSVLSNEDESELLKLKREDNETEGKKEEVPEFKVDIPEVLESHGCKREGFKQVSVIKTYGTEETQIRKVDGQEVRELQKETKRVSIEKARVQDEEENMKIKVKQDNLAQHNKEDGDQRNPDFKVIIPVNEAEEIVITDADSDMAMQNGEDELWSFQVGSDFTQNKVEDDLSALVSRALKNDLSERQYACIQTKTPLSDKEEVQSNKDDQSKTDTKHPTSKRGMSNSADESDSASAESDSDEELQLYMHCLRAAGAPAQVHKDKIRNAGFKARNRPSVSRGKVPPTSMPSISEALDEEQQHNSPLDTYEDVKTALESRSNLQESVNQTEWRRKGLFSCSNVPKTLLYASLMVVFTVVAYHYDFLACFLLYLMSVIWLCCQGAIQPIKDK